MVSKLDVIDFLKCRTEEMVKKCTKNNDGYIFCSFSGKPIKVDVECNAESNFSVNLVGISEDGDDENRSSHSISTERLLECFLSDSSEDGSKRMFKVIKDAMQWLALLK